MGYAIHHGDCRDVMRAMPANSIDSIVCDPPYGLGFMGKGWDHGVPGVEFWIEALRVAKPGAHLLAFGGTRMYHRLMVAIEDAGWEIRDTIMWVYGSGFPKSLDVSKAIDKAAGAVREVTRAGQTKAAELAGQFDQASSESRERRDIPATEAAKQWEGWGTALKPAWEPVIVARKTMRGTVADNVLAHGTGALNIDACRVPFADEVDEQASKGKNAHADFDSGARNNERVMGEHNAPRAQYEAPARWPANLIHDGSDEVVALFPDSDGAGGSLPNVKITGYGDGIGTGKSEYFGGDRIPFNSGTGSAARFFYCAKASREDRNEGLEGFDKKALNWSSGTQSPGTFQAPGTDRTSENHHPTVKPTDLMRYLIRMVTPPGGIPLDPFAGSGSTGKAAILEGFSPILIEQEAEYIPIIDARLAHAERTYLDATRQQSMDFA